MFRRKKGVFHPAAAPSPAAAPTLPAISLPVVPPLLAAVLLFLLLLAACGDGEGRTREGGEEAVPVAREAASREPGVWSLSEDPTLEIGVVEGEEEYQLHRVGGSVRLDDGRIVVANTGSRELRVFGPDGDFLGSVGRDGEGPGEFRSPSRIRRLAGDTLMVWDDGLFRISLFDAEGDFLAMAPLLPSPEDLFPGDEWLLERNWIDSPVAPSRRERLRRAVERLPPADTSAGLRFVKVTREGWLWVSPTRALVDTALTWEVYDLEGERRATVATPARFQLHEVGSDYVLGRYLDSMDVNYVRLYRLQKPPDAPEAPGLSPSVAFRPGSDEPQASRSGGVDEETLASMRAMVKILASRQEIHYADHFTYTTDVEDLGGLGGPAADEVAVEIPFAAEDGWMVLLTHRETGDMCVMTYGYYVPMGWSPGRVICP